jgi:hypothetical protein
MLLTLLLLTLSAPFDPKAQVPTGREDFSAFRVDSEVWGWNKDFTEMATIVQEVARAPDAEIEGELAMMIFPVGSTKPIVNVTQAITTQAVRPEHPSSFPDIFDMMKFATGSSYGHDLKDIWPEAPLREHHKGFMTIEPIWIPVETEKGLCAPAIGYVLSMHGEIRYQPHELAKMRASCPYLRWTDSRIYWAKKDLGAVMIRFDYSATDNEYSIRFPLSVAWNFGKKINISFISAIDDEDMRLRLKRYGKISTKRDAKVQGRVIYFKPEFLFLAKQLQQNLNYEIRPAEPDAIADIQVISGATVAVPKKTMSTPPLESSPPKNESEYLKDWFPK